MVVKDTSGQYFKEEFEFWLRKHILLLEVGLPYIDNLHVT